MIVDLACGDCHRCCFRTSYDPRVELVFVERRLIVLVGRLDQNVIQTLVVKDELIHPSTVKTIVGTGRRLGEIASSIGPGPDWKRRSAL